MKPQAPNSKASSVTSVESGFHLGSRFSHWTLDFECSLGFGPWDLDFVRRFALLTDANGVRLAKRNDALSLRTLRERGADPERVRQEWKAD